MIDFLHQAKDFLNPKFLIDYMLALWAGMCISGYGSWSLPRPALRSAFFLPGDSMLVVAGLFAAAGKLNVALVMLAFFFGSVIGDSTGYWTGRVMGKTLFNRESSWVFSNRAGSKRHTHF